MTELKGKVIVVTGASAGIGKSIVESLVSVGAKVIGCARNVEKLKVIETTLNGKGPGEIKVTKCDVSVEDDVIKAFEFAKTHYGTLHAIINNAGILDDEPLLTGSTDGWMRMLQVNVMGVAICTREAVKLMKKSGVDDGHVININSLSGHRVLNSSRIHFYAATKYAVTALTEGLRQELRAEKSHIRVTAISPGLAKTDILNKCYPNPKDLADYWETIQTLESQDVADAVLYAITAPARVDVSDIYIRSFEQST